MSVHEELLKRYKYLYENKELILANCIIYDIEKDYIKKELKSLKLYVKKADNQDLKAIFSNAIKSYKNDLKTPKPYLSSEIPEEYASIIEELVLGDIDLEDTRLYKYIEGIKSNKEALLKCDMLISALEERRWANQHLKNIPTFTVWKILSYIRKKYDDNDTVLRALDKYYNLDRYMIADDDCSYGYYIPDDENNIFYDYPDSTLYGSSYGSCVAWDYEGNEFEEEDKYLQPILNKALSVKSYPSEFAKCLANSKMLENKQEKLKDIKASKSRVRLNH